MRSHGENKFRRPEDREREREMALQKLIASNEKYFRPLLSAA